jgi:uncharacterized protein (TIGR00159 family)
LIFLFKIGFLNVSWIDILDILLVAGLIYQIYKLMQGSVAMKIFLGFLSLYLIYLVVSAAQMELLSAILGQFMGVGILAMIILFTQEIRKFLLVIGKTAPIQVNSLFKGIFYRHKEAAYNITPIVEACKSLGATNTGALFVLSKDSGLKFYAESGDILNAELNKRLLISIFDKNSPLHDGAVIVYKGKIKAARCVLPVSDNPSLPPNLGLRHRAAVGMSEITDTMVVVVSEETGQISLTFNGKLVHNVSLQELRSSINEYLLAKEPPKIVDPSDDTPPADEISPISKIQTEPST